jgi:hypothetical protein
MRALVRKVHEGSHSEHFMEPLILSMTRGMIKKGHVLFKRGDLAKEMYPTLSGSIRRGYVFRVTQASRSNTNIFIKQEGD